MPRKKEGDNYQIFSQSQGETSLIGTFKKLYYHFYSNSEVSRAESIFEDIAKLILIKTLAERSEDNNVLTSYISDNYSANDTLLPVLIEKFPKLISKDNLFAIGDNAIRKGLSYLSNVNISSAPASILGEAFQAVIGPRLRGEKGQFFTPKALVKLMVKVSSPKPSDKIVDPAAGTGNFLIESQIFREKSYPNESNYGPIIGLEKDKDLYRLGGAMLSIITNGVGSMHLVNSLDLKAISKIDESPFNADIVLTNPPFGTRIGISSITILKDYLLGHDWSYSSTDKRWHELSSIRKSQDPQLLFLELCLKIVKPGGLVGIILPEGVFGNRKSGYVWDFVTKIGEIECMIDCPRTTFQPSTDTKTNVVFIRRTKLAKLFFMSEPLIAVAKTCGHDRRGREFKVNGTPFPNDFEKIGDGYANKDPKWWTRCQITDPYYLVPRFYHHGADNALLNKANELNGEVVTIKKLIKEGYLYIRKGHEVGSEAYGSGDIPFIRTSDINNWEVSMNTTNGVSEDIYLQYYKSQNLKPYDILLVVDGRYKIGKTAIIQPNNCKSVVQSHFRIITVSKKCPINSYELLFLLNMPSVLEQIRNLTFIQSTLGSVGKRLDMIQIVIPKKTAQWNQTIKEFRDAIEGRAILLDKLKSLETPEIDL